jgi:hypothetical protein
MRRAVRCFAASIAVASLVGRAALAAPPAELDWQAPPGCGSREQVLSEVSRLVATAPAEPLVARARVKTKGKNFQVVIEIAGSAHGSRTLRAHSCESLARATALIIAMAIDPQAAAVVSEQAENSPEPEPPARDRPAPEAPVQLPPARAAALRPLVFLGFFGEHALAPRLALGAEAGAGLGWRFARGDLAAGLIPRASATLPDDPSVSGEFTLAFIALRGCAGVVEPAIGISGCATLRGARVWARGEGASPSLDQTAHVLSLEPGLLLRVAGADAVGAELTANLVVPLTRPHFVIAQGESQRELFRPPGLGAIVKLALSYEF